MPDDSEICDQNSSPVSSVALRVLDRVQLVDQNFPWPHLHLSGKRGTPCYSVLVTQMVEHRATDLKELGLNPTIFFLLLSINYHPKILHYWEALESNLTSFGIWGLQRDLLSCIVATVILVKKKILLPNWKGPGAGVASLWDCLMSWVRDPLWTRRENSPSVNVGLREWGQIFKGFCAEGLFPESLFPEWTFHCIEYLESRMTCSIIWLTFKDLT